MQHDAKIVRMANQIATFFLSQPEEVRAPGVASSHQQVLGTAARRLEVVDGEVAAISAAGGRGLQAGQPDPSSPPSHRLIESAPDERMVAEGPSMGVIKIDDGQDQVEDQPPRRGR